jgi:serine/threonine-protein kinase RsbW
MVAGPSGVPHDDAERAMSAPYVALDLEIPSDVREIEPTVDAVTSACSALHLPDRQCTLNIPVALSEALSNAIIRGNREDPRKHVRLRTTVSDAAIVFDVADEGPGFDMASVHHDPALRADLEREDGRGLFLMQQLMDRVEQIGTHPHVIRLTLKR